MNIPNIFHFCWPKGGRPFGLVEYLAIKSAYEVNRPQEMFLYLEGDLVGSWGEMACKYVKVEKVSFAREVSGVKIGHLAHQSDVMRLEKLNERGGVYLDLDVLCVRPFRPLYEKEMVLGKEVVGGKVVGLANAVMLARPGARFLKRWLEGYDPKKSLWRGFRSRGFDQYYSEMSVKYPNFVAQYWPEEIHVEEYTSFYYPSWDEVELQDFYKGNLVVSKRAYCHHLWATAAGRYLSDMTEEEIEHGRTTFAKLAARFL